MGDFGLARKLKPDADEIGEKEHSIVGTLSLLAPEVFTDASYGSSVDWWALGLMFGEMLLGEAPIPAVDENHVTIQQLLALYMTDTHIQRFNVETSEAAASCVRGFLTVRVENRLTSLSELKLHAFFDGASSRPLASRPLASRPLANLNSIVCWSFQVLIGKLYVRCASPHRSRTSHHLAPTMDAVPTPSSGTVGFWQWNECSVHLSKTPERW